MLFLINNHSIHTFEFKHDLFTVDKKRVLAFCEKIKPLGISWGCDSRIGVIDTEMVDRMVETGLTNIFFGIESGSASMQTTINKKLNLEEADAMVQYCVKKGLKVTTSFIYGFPEETDKTATATLQMSVRFQNYGCNVLTNLCHITNGTEMYERYKKQLLFKEGISFNKCIMGLPQLRPLITRHIEMFANFCDYPNPLRKELCFFDVFRYTLNHIFSTHPHMHQQLMRHDYASIAMYRQFCKVNSEVLGTDVPSADGNVTSTRHTLKHGISPDIYNLMAKNLLAAYE